MISYLDGAHRRWAQALSRKVMVPAHFHDLKGHLFDHNVGKILGLSKILTVIL